MSRKVIIGTPCYSGQLDVWYVHSLTKTIKMAAERDVEITPIWVSFDAMVQRARNDTVHIALDMGVDDLIWIDSDIEWEPEWFYRLLDYPQDIVGGTYRKKGDIEEYVIREKFKRPIDKETGLLEVDGLGMGFVKTSRKSLQYLWDVSQSYIDQKDNLERRMIFDVILKDNDMMSEDIVAFEKLKEGSFQIWLDPAMTCNHTGPYKFKGDFRPWYNNPNKSKIPGLPAVQQKFIPRAPRQL